MPNDVPSHSIQYIKGVGPQRAHVLRRLGIESVRDALFYLPYRYEDRTALKKIASLSYGSPETVAGTIISTRIIRTPGRNFQIFEAVLNDGSALLTGKWFNQPFLKKTLPVGSTVILHGIVKKHPYWGIGFEMDNPDYEIVTSGEDTSCVHMNRIVPVYRVTAGISVRQFRSLMFHIVQSHSGSVADPFPPSLLEKYRLPGLRETLNSVHFPAHDVDLHLLNRRESIFHRRLSFDEFFMLQLGLALLKKKNRAERGIAVNPAGTLLSSFRNSLPFRLTDAQDRVLREILDDMGKPHPMHRLIQGDVGSGKTVIALMAMLATAECGYQSALMAPTEILAEQHYLNIRHMVERIGLRVCLVTGSRKERHHEEIARGDVDMVIGTHSLIQEGVVFRRLGLAVIDEQHRFGVMQRSLLRRKAVNPHVLVMTATPIPRTLALTVFGDLDYSLIDRMPPGRQPVKTLLFHPDRRETVYENIREEVAKGRQVYVVYPAIEESGKTDLRAALTGKKAFERLFPSFRIGLMHGKMKTEERERIMTTFKAGDIDVLVSTTVIEVGVDVPNATLMIIIHAERFGLSQLHQLRGRIGRGHHESACILLAYPPYGEDARRRLECMVSKSDGFAIAEEDLQIRGPGELFGTKQSGMPDLKIGNILRDGDLLSAARREAFALIEEDPTLSTYPLLRNELERFWEGRRELLETA